MLEPDRSQTGGGEGGVTCQTSTLITGIQLRNGCSHEIISALKVNPKYSSGVRRKYFLGLEQMSGHVAVIDSSQFNCQCCSYLSDGCFKQSHIPSNYIHFLRIISGFLTEKKIPFQNDSFPTKFKPTTNSQYNTSDSQTMVREPAVILGLSKRGIEMNSCCVSSAWELNLSNSVNIRFSNTVLNWTATAVGTYRYCTRRAQCFQG